MAHPHSMMSAEEIDLLIHSHLVESGYAHTSFSLLHESSLALQPQPIPPGHLVRILQKGLLYLEAEARYRGDPPTPAPRLVGYPIPNALPLPPLPKHGKGKAKEEPPVKRKATSDKDDPDPKRPRTVSGGSPDVVLPKPKPTLPPVKTTASVSVSPSISRAPSPNVARKPSASTSALQPKKKSTPTVEPAKAASSSVLSAPSTPALGAAASVAASDRQSSLPKQEPVKKEEPEFKEEPCSMEGVRQFGADDPTVVRLRGHTTPVRCSCTCSPSVTDLARRKCNRAPGTPRGCQRCWRREEGTRHVASGTCQRRTRRGVQRRRDLLSRTTSHASIRVLSVVQTSQP